MTDQPRDAGVERHKDECAERLAHVESGRDTLKAERDDLSRQIDFLHETMQAREAAVKGA